MIIKYFNINDVQLKNAWNKLISQSKSHTVFQTYEWMSVWVNQMGLIDRDNCDVMALLIDGKIEAILPLYIETIGFIKVLKFFADGQNDYQGILFNSSKISIDKLYSILSKNELLESYDVLYLKKIPNLGSEHDDLNFYKYTSHSLYGSHSVLKTSNCTSLMNIIPKKLLADNRRCIRNIEKLGELEFVFESVGAIREKVVNFIIKHKSLQYRRTGVPDLFKSENIRSFYAGKFENYTVVSYLSLNDRIVAAHWGVYYNNTMYYLMPAYDTGFERYSPGKILIHKMIDELSSMGCNEFDFSIGDEPYKLDWCNHHKKIGEVLTPISIKGILYVKIVKLRKYLKENHLFYSFARFALRLKYKFHSCKNCISI